MTEYDSVPWVKDPVRKAILNEPGKTIHNLREQVDDLQTRLSAAEEVIEAARVTMEAYERLRYSIIQYEKGK